MSSSNEFNDKKISSLIKEKLQAKEKLFGVEISSKINEGLTYNDFKVQPAFVSIVWDGLSSATIEKLSEINSKGVIVLPHLSCYKISTPKLDEILQKADCSNVLVIRGDSVSDSQEFKYASDMVKKIKELRQDSISIGVCGYPDVHPDSSSREEDLRNLKFKVDCGADFIVTQMCFSYERISNFIKDCRSMGINQPIIPGIYVPSSWCNLQKMLKITNVRIEEKILSQFEMFKNDVVGFMRVSENLCTEITKKLFEESVLECNAVHYFTFNQFDVVRKVADAIF